MGMVIDGSNASVVHSAAAAPWTRWSDSTLDTIWNLRWHLYTSWMDTTYPGGIGIGDYSGSSCLESAIAFLVQRRGNQVTTHASMKRLQCKHFEF